MGELTMLILVGGLAVLALAIWLMYFIAKQFAEIAADKGYTDKKYFWICFWLGMVGYIMVAAMPCKTDKIIENTKKAASEELPEI